SAKVTTKIARVKMEITGPFAVTIDSADPKEGQNNPLGKAMASVVKTLAKVEFTATLKPTGEMSDFKISDALVQEFRGLPGSALMGELATEQGLKTMLSQGSVELPKEPIAIGGTWTQRTSNKLPMGTVSGEMKFTFRGPEAVDGKTCQK